MALIRCRKCGKEISDKAVDCIHCGELIIKGNADNAVDSAQGLSERKLPEQEFIFLNDIAKLEEEKQNLENENAKFKAQVAEAENVLANKQSENARLESEKNALLQQNTALKSQISDSQKTITVLEQKHNQLIEQNNTLENQLSQSQKAVNVLERKIEHSQKAKKIQKSSQLHFKQICELLRLILMIFFVLGALVSLFGREYRLAIWYASVAIAVAPYLYRLVWKRVNVHRYIRNAVEIIVPIIIALL